VGGGRSRRREPQDLTLPASSTERLDAVGYLLTADAYLHPGASCVHDDLLALEAYRGALIVASTAHVLAPIRPTRWVRLDGPAPATAVYELTVVE
jgi:hypothetical protein